MNGRRQSQQAAKAAISTSVGLALIATLGAGTAGAAAPTTDEEKTLYYLGTMAARSVRDLHLSKEESTWMLQGVRDTLDDAAMELDDAVYGPMLQTLATERQAVALEKEKVASKAFLEQAANAIGASVTPSGLIYTEMSQGSGAQPGPTDTVMVHYHGTMRDGTVFDSSVVRGEPAEFPLNRVIPCWTEGVALIKVGGKSKLVCPPEIAYGERGAPPTVPGGAVLTFEVELLEIVAK